MAEDDDTPKKGLMDRARDELGKAAARHAAKATMDEASRRARQAVESALGGAEQWVGREAASAEARREASGLPDTTPERDWSDDLAGEGEAAFQRARRTLVDDDDDDDAEEAEEAAARAARARDELARLKAALAGGEDPLLDEARRTLQRVSSAQGATPVHDEADLDAELEAMAAEVAAVAGSLDVPTQATSAPVASAPAAPTASRPTITPVEADDDEDPIAALLARAAAARQAARDDDDDVQADVDGSPDRAPDPTPSEEVDPSLAALAAARAARAAATDDVRAQARARAEAIALEAMEAPRHQAVDLFPGDPGDAPAEPTTAEQVLERARQARIDAGTAADPHDEARRAARERIARLTAAPPTPSELAQAPHSPVAHDPLARARAALDAAATSRGVDANDHSERMKRARELLRQRAYEKSAAQLAREVLEQAGLGPDAEALATQALADSERIRAEQQEIALAAQRKAQAYGEAMARRAEAARDEIERRMAARVAYAESAGSEQDRTEAALQAAARARAQAEGRDPEREAVARMELERLKAAQSQRADLPPGTPPRRTDLVGDPPPADSDAGDDDESDPPGDPADHVPKRRL